MEDRKSNKWAEIVKALPGEVRKHHRLTLQYETLRAQLTRDAEGNYGPRDVVKEMQAIEAKRRKIWTPHRERVGPCPKCNGTREPATMGADFGFGCSGCNDFEVYGTGKPAYPSHDITPDSEVMKGQMCVAVGEVRYTVEFYEFVKGSFSVGMTRPPNTELPAFLHDLMLPRWPTYAEAKRAVVRASHQNGGVILGVG